MEPNIFRISDPSLFQRLEEDDTDAHLSSEWADPRSLKNSFTGMGGQVKWKIGGGF